MISKESRTRDVKNIPCPVCPFGSVVSLPFAILELAKGKLTTDPKGHTGQGIFFTSRVLDSFDIISYGVFFTHTFGVEEDWILERPEATDGTEIGRAHV